MQEGIQPAGELGLRKHLLIAAVFLGSVGLATRLFLLFVSGNLPVGPFSGTGDQERYRILAESVYRGNGLTYAGQPTALRAPGYPILLAAAHQAFGYHYFLAMRIVQLLAGLLLAYVCVKLGRQLFNGAVGLLSGALALALPTLVFIGIELQTEALAALLTALFLFSALKVLEDPSDRPLSLGLYSGLSALFRFNAALLPLLAAVGLLWRDRGLKRAVFLSVVTGALILPWFVRNEIVFHGHVLYSTHGGINLLEGVLVPQGRAQPEDSGRVQAAVGWAHTDIETNDASRLQFPSEDRLDQQARAAALSAWRALGWKARTRLLGSKVVWFWLGTDQLFATSSFSRPQRSLRAAGVIAYWIVLVLAVLGWGRLLARKRIFALVLLFYCVIVTAAHLPFVMNTRLRIPFIDPLLAVLAAGGIDVLIGRTRGLMEQTPET